MSDECIITGSISQDEHSFIGTGYKKGTKVPVPSYFADWQEVTDTTAIDNALRHGKQTLNHRIDSIAKLKGDWNGYGAAAFPSAVIENARSLISLLPCKAKVFPTVQSSIQFEFDSNPGKYLEVEVFSDHYAMFFADSDSQEEKDQTDREYILQRISEYDAK